MPAGRGSGGAALLSANKHGAARLQGMGCDVLKLYSRCASVAVLVSDGLYSSGSRYSNITALKTHIKSHH